MKRIHCLMISSLLVAFLAAACSSSEPEQGPDEASTKSYPNLTQLSPPDTARQHQPANVYIDSVTLISRNSRTALLISGNLPDGCSKLGEARHTMAGDTLRLTLSAWKPSDRMCTQALVPFSYIYDQFPNKAVQPGGSVVVNEDTYKVSES